MGEGIAPPGHAYHSPIPPHLRREGEGEVRPPPLCQGSTRRPLVDRSGQGGAVGGAGGALLVQLLSQVGDGGLQGQDLLYGGEKGVMWVQLLSQVGDGGLQGQDLLYGGEKDVYGECSVKE